MLKRIVNGGSAAQGRGLCWQFPFLMLLAVVPGSRAAQWLAGELNAHIAVSRKWGRSDLAPKCGRIPSAAEPIYIWFTSRPLILMRREHEHFTHRCSFSLADFGHKQGLGRMQVCPQFLLLPWEKLAEGCYQKTPLKLLASLRWALQWAAPWAEEV